jgi:flagellar protein FlaG
MAGFEGSIKVPNPASAVVASIPRPQVTSAVQVASVVSSEPDVNANPQSSVSVTSKAETLRKLESPQQLEQNFGALRVAAAELNEAVKAKAINLSFSVDEPSKRFVVEVEDSKTGEIIRVIPGEAVLRTAATLDALKGLLFDDVY